MDGPPLVPAPTAGSGGRRLKPPKASGSFARMLTSQTSTNNGDLWPTLDVVSPPPLGDFPDTLGNNRRQRSSRGVDSVAAVGRSSESGDEFDNANNYAGGSGGAYAALDEDDEDAMATAPPAYRANYGTAIGQALQQKEILDSVASKGKAKGAGGGGGKKKKKSMILFTTNVRSYSGN